MTLRKAVKIKYSPELIYSYILSCLVDDKGVPRFMIKVFGIPLEENTALLTCRDFDEQDLLVSLHIKDIPKEIYDIIAQKDHKDLAEWKKVLAAIMEPESIPELQKIKPRVFSQDDIKKMIAFAMQFKTKKVSKEESKEIADRILGPETFYDIFK